MSKIGLMGLLFSLVLAGCTSGTSPTNPAKAVRDPDTKRFAADIQALCYGRSVSDPSEIAEDVSRSCPKGSQSFEILHQDSFWNRCPLLQPVRITYRCGPAQE